MTDDVDLEASGLLDGLDGQARAERAELIGWLLDQGVALDQIRGNSAPMLLASRRIIGDDGEYVSARQSAEKFGVDVELFVRIQRAMGLPRVDDPDAAVFLRADAREPAPVAEPAALGHSATAASSPRCATIVSRKA